MEILNSIDYQEELEIMEMHKRQRDLHLVLTPVCYVTLEVLDKDNNAISLYKDRSKSWVRNFYNWMVTQQMTCNSNALGTTYGEGTIAARNTGGTVRQATTPHHHLIANNGTGFAGYRAASADATAGIQIGTGTTAETFESHVLTTLIANGTGAGQMQYQEMAQPIPVWNSSTKKMTLTLTRQIVNNSGNAIGVNEIGLVSRHTWGSSASDLCLVARDKLNTTVNVPHQGQLVATYTLEITYPV